jgi:hypothetical protein
VLQVPLNKSPGRAGLFGNDLLYFVQFRSLNLQFSSVFTSNENIKTIPDKGQSPHPRHTCRPLKVKNQVMT